MLNSVIMIVFEAHLSSTSLLYVYRNSFPH